jgi:hypothetical protein
MHSMDLTIVKQLLYTVDEMFKINNDDGSLLCSMVNDYAEKNGNSCLSVIAYDFGLMIPTNPDNLSLLLDIYNQLKQMINNGVPYCDDCMWKLKTYSPSRIWI